MAHAKAKKFSNMAHVKAKKISDMVHVKASIFQHGTCQSDCFGVQHGTCMSKRFFLGPTWHMHVKANTFQHGTYQTYYFPNMAHVKAKKNFQPCFKMLG
jgi:hypothetical protein